MLRGLHSYIKQDLICKYSTGSLCYSSCAHVTLDLTKLGKRHWYQVGVLMKGAPQRHPAISKDEGWANVYTRARPSVSIYIASRKYWSRRNKLWFCIQSKPKDKFLKFYKFSEMLFLQHQEFISTTHSTPCIQARN